MKKLLFILLFIPLILFSQETKVKNEFIYDSFKEDFLKVTDGITYYNGEPYTGVFYGNYENGQLKQKSNYKDGKLDGLFESYYDSGQLEYQKNYKDGKLDGNWSFIYGLGQVGIQTFYKDDEEYGMRYQYLFNGQLMRKNYIDSDGKWTNLRHIIKHTNIKNVNVYDLEAMIKVFLGDCEENNIKLLKDYKITSTFETLDKGKVALSYGIFNDKEIIIKVSPQEWSKASNPKRWYILYHELGHDVLNLKHGQGGKMMFNFTEEDYTWDDFFKDKFYMLNSIKREEYEKKLKKAVSELNNETIDR